MLTPLSQQDSQDAALGQSVDHFTLCHGLRGRWLQKFPGAHSLCTLFLAAMQRNSCSQSGNAVILWGKL